MAKNIKIKSAEDRISAAVEVVKGICDNSFNCVDSGGKPRCKECKIGALYVALGVYDQRHVGNACDQKMMRMFESGMGVRFGTEVIRRRADHSISDWGFKQCKGCPHAKERKTRLSACPNFEPKKPEKDIDPMKVAQSLEFRARRHQSKKGAK